MLRGDVERLQGAIAEAERGLQEEQAAGDGLGLTICFRL